MKKWMMIPAVVGMIACNSGEGTNNDENTSDSTMVENTGDEMAMAGGELLHFGDTVAFEGAMSTDEMLAVLAEKDSAEVKVKGEILAVCQKKGCWMSMPLSDEESMHVSFDYVFLLPTGGIEGKEVVIEGKVKKSTIGVDHLRHLAEDAGKSQEEIDAITEPETKLSFLATGVTIKS
ncbi:DUF4920 domain-containing protein [Phaeocystidibacter luteus]|uniref:DUF4920 domain-containing protein n=1 Tax=Phaeocystidibacter luteus TaxID=911197 RepID=A0A6N6RMJ6_9FLAO|nr:DUF4920 domain-containing protein [Phaeocystidibacter luteus]KAB2814785.1 DUF4920 domain-containing protein [Phaeocystidibacter luteus]